MADSQPVHVYIAVPHEVQAPASLVTALLSWLGISTPGQAITAPSPPTVTPGTFVQVATGPSGCWCLKWVEDTRGFGGAYRGQGYLTANDAERSWRSSGFAVDSPQPGDFVFYAPANSNGHAGHVGIVTGANQFVSLWCDGRVMQGPMDLFGQQNGTVITSYMRVPQPAVAMHPLEG